MDSDWDEVTRISHPPPGVHGLPTPPTTIAFDNSRELLWAGNEFGRVSSFYGPELQRYTSWKAQPSAEGAIRQILFNAKGVISLGARGLHMADRRGPPFWNLRPESMLDMRCMCFTSKGQSEVLVAGGQDKMFIVDVSKGVVVKEIPTNHHYILMKSGRHIYAATTSGEVNILDPLTYNIIKTWNAHSAMINDMDVQHDFVVTCGYSIRPGGAYMLDPLVNVFDLKNMASMPPIPFPAGAAFVRMHPRMNTTSIVVSQHGQMHIVDLLNPNTSNVRQANILTFVSMFEIASSGEAIVLVDGECQILLFGSRSKIQFAEFPQPVEFADQDQEQPYQVIDWDENTPLSMVGMPHYKDTLLSSWPSNMMSEVGAPPVKFDPQFLATLKQADFGLYGPNTRGLRRNQVEETRTVEKSRNAIQPPKFLSEKARESSSRNGSEHVSHVSQASGSGETVADQGVPSKYHQLEIKYSKFGIDDFDFGFYNATQYSGLETQIPNVYANPLLQILYYTPLVRNFALQHAASSCVNELCLLCELGYLSDNLQKAEGSICHASNMLKNLNHHSQAGQLGLLDDDPRGSTPAQMIQGLTRFLLDRFIQNFFNQTNSNALEQVFQTNATNAVRCTSCHSESTRAAPTNVIDLIYPHLSSARNQKTRLTFSRVLKSSIERETTTKGWCSRCRTYQLIANRKTIHRVPAVFLINTAIGNADNKRLWATPGWLPEEIGVIINNGQFFCYEKEDLKLHLERGMHSITVYSLVGVVVDIDLALEHQKKSHLVAMVDVGVAESPAPAESKWHIFNDFLVCPVPGDDGLGFGPTWKTPVVLAYQVKSANHKVDADWRRNLDTSLLFHDFRPGDPNRTYRRLDPQTEMPGPNTIVALDSEFVSVRPPEIEMNSEGAQSTLKPTVFALGRVSVVRGEGLDAGLASIDDYVHIKEPVVDYLTEFSGITRADLDPQLSTRNLLPLKIVFKRLWLLSNMGCKFLGHGLKQDFRVINIHIPRSQVIDTIDLFYTKSRLRKLSLSFLAWVILKSDIQQETHDSIEDSRTALSLYRKYLEFTDAGVLEAILQDVYKTGEKYKFKAPKRGEGGGSGAASSTIPDSTSVARTETPPVASDAATGPGPSTPRRGGLGGAAAAGGTPGGWTPGRASPYR